MARFEKCHDPGKTYCIRVSAPGKVILHGEHSVVYGKKAVAAALGLRTHLTLSTDPSNPPTTCDHTLTLNFPDVNLTLPIFIPDAEAIIFPDGAVPLNAPRGSAHFEHPEFIAHETLISSIETYLEPLEPLDHTCHNAVVITLYLYFGMVGPLGISKQSMNIHVQSEIKVSAGMGSSASFAVCLAAGFLEFIKQWGSKPENSLLVNPVYNEICNFRLGIFNQREMKLISRWAFQAEKVTHGNPSGIDNSVCTFGSSVQFRKENDPVPMELKYRLTGLLIDTMIPKDTKAMVGKVAQKREQMPEVVNRILESMEATAVSSIELLQSMNCLAEVDGTLVNSETLESHYQKLNTNFDKNQGFLETLGVSHPAIENVCSILKKYDLHGKLTGAGGGGYVICLVPHNFSEQMLAEALDDLQREQYICKLLILGGKGVQVD